MTSGRMCRLDALPAAIHRTAWEPPEALYHLPGSESGSSESYTDHSNQDACFFSLPPLPIDIGERYGATGHFADGSSRAGIVAKQGGRCMEDWKVPEKRSRREPGRNETL